MSHRTFFVARTGEDEEPFNCGLYSLTTGWSYAPLRMASEDRAAFVRRLAQGCDDWARLHFEFRPRAAVASPGATWTTAATFDSANSAPDEQLAEIEND